MLDTGEDFDVASQEIGMPVEQLLTPLTRRRRQRPNDRFTIDNGAFAKFSPANFLSLLERNKDGIELCRWVAVPDVVGSAIRTCEVFERWKGKMPGWRLAFVAQDGQENYPIPWDDIECLFLGGTDQFKLGRHGAECVKAAKALGKWCHIGRVNTPGRMEYFDKMGADSIDGTGIARYSHMRKKIADNQIKEKYPELWTQE
jgi:hypothetical protein